MPASEIPLQSCNKLESCLNLVSIPSNVQITNIQFELSELTISKQLNESCNRVEGREERCIWKITVHPRNSTIHPQSIQTKPTETKPAKSGQKNRSKTTSKSARRQHDAHRAQVTPRNWRSQRAKGLQGRLQVSSSGKGYTFRSHQRWTHFKLTQDKLLMDQQR